MRNGNGREMANKFRLKARVPRNFQGSLTCCKSATWDRRLYFPSEGRRAEDFFARKIRRLRPGLNPRSWVPEASMLTTRPPKPLHPQYVQCFTATTSIPRTYDYNLQYQNTLAVSNIPNKRTVNSQLCQMLYPINHLNF